MKVPSLLPFQSNLVIYGKIDDGYNSPVYSYSLGKLTIRHSPEENIPPTITITHPPAEGAEADTSYTIKWSDSDPDDNAIISLYYDTDNQGHDGILIDDEIEEDDPADAYTWDTSDIEEGSYYIYGKIDDGYNSPVYSYSLGKLSITHPPREKEWTILVYLDGDNNLEPAAIDDLNEMEMVGSSDLVNIVVQFDRIPGYDSSNGDWTTTRRYYVTKDNNPTIINSQLIEDLGELNMADPKTLAGFINWGMENYPAKKYALILWNHGGGWKESASAIMGKSMYRANKAICWDETSGNDCLFMSEVKLALSQTEGVSLLGLDACLMGMIEVGYQITDYAEVMVASEEVEPWDGWPYDTILPDLVNDPTMDSEALGRVIVKRYSECYEQEPSGTLSAINLDCWTNGPLIDSISAFADSLNTYWKEITTAREQTEEYHYPQHVDFYHFVDLISKGVADEEIKEKAEDLKQELFETVIANWGSPYHPNSNGLAIYFPRTIGEFDEGYNDSTIDFPRLTTWDEFLARYLSPSPTPPIIDEIETVPSNTPYKISWKASEDADGIAGYELQEAAGSSGTIFYDDVESGEGSWVKTGLWHISTHRSSSPTHSWYYGQEEVWNYDTGEANSGSITSPAIDLPYGATLSFSHWLENEDYGSPYDGAHVQISTDGGVSWSSLVSYYYSINSWSSVTIDLNAYSGKTVQIRFFFDTIDATFNDYEGWYVDDIKIEASGWKTLDNNIQETFYEIPGRPKGTYLYRARARDNMGKWSKFGNTEDVIITGPDNIPPTITITHPPATGATADTSYTIRWIDSDPDSNAIISLYYDTDNTGYDGTQIATSISEDDQTDAYIWGCSSIPNGIYYIYAKIDDGTNPPVYDYSDGALTISHDSQKKRWTFMVYLDADNNLEGAGIDDLNEMEMVGSSNQVNIIVQFDRIPGYDSSNGDWTTTRRYYVTKDNNPNIINSQLIADLGELNMADPATLRDFALWGIQNYPAENYALVLWNHGGGWREAIERLKAHGVENPERAVCWDDTSGYDCLYMKEVQTALSQVVSPTGTKIHLVGFDACLMGMTEVAYEIKDYALVAVGAEDVEPWDGWPYDTILADLVKSPNIAPDELSGVIVKRYGQFYSDTPRTTQSAVDLTKMVELSTSISSLADSMNSYWNQIKQARYTTQEYYDSDHVDLFHFADRISELVPDTEIVNKANMVKDRVKIAVIAEWHGSGRPNSHGLAIYFPRTFISSYYNGSTIDFPKDTTWDEFLKRFIANKEPVPMPRIERVVIRDLTHIDLHFDGEVPIEVSPLLFDVSQADDPKVKIAVTEARIDRKDDRLVHLTTSPLVEGKFYVVTLNKIRGLRDIPDTSLEFALIKSGAIEKEGVRVEIPVGTFDGYIALHLNLSPSSSKISQADSASSEARITRLIPNTTREIIAYDSRGGRLTASHFHKKVRLTIPYEDRYPEQDELSFRIFYLDEASSKWVLIPGRQEVDYINNTVSASIPHFSIYQIGQTTGPAATNLKDVKVYPNPYKPSEADHRYIVFKNLTDGVRIRVFNIAGELVYERELDRGGVWEEWQATNNEDEKLASGIYIYIITNDKGETAKGKLSIIK